MVKTRTQSKSATPKTRGPAKCSQGTSKDNKGTTTPCMGCGKNVTDSVKALQCERCISKTLPNGSWKCTNCIGMSDKLYDALVSESNTLHWFCNNCEQEALADTGSTSPITSAEIISSVENLATTMLQKMADLENRLSTKVQEVESRLQESLTTESQPKCDHLLQKFETHLESSAMCINDIQRSQQKIEGKVDSIQSNTDKAEEEEILSRQTNLIIHGVSESDSDDVKQRIEDDLLQTATMLQELNIEGVMVEKVIRLGKKPEGSNPKPRPMKVVVDTTDNRNRIIRKAKNLRLIQKDGWCKVFVHQDLTPKQRETRNALIQEMKQRTMNGEEGLIIQNGRIEKRRNHHFQQSQDLSA